MVFVIVSEEIVTPKILQTYRNSSKAKLAHEALLRSSSGEVTTNGFIALRNDIIIEVLLSNGCRAGGLLAIRHRHLTEINQDPETSVGTIAVHS